jgi:predicted NBD/HSP70 family sugar kinase
MDRPKMTDSTTRNLRRRNRAAILRELLRGGETTRGKLASALSLSPATVTNVVADLAGEGLVHDTGSLPSDGGRPTTTLSVRPEGAYFIGADVGEHGVTVELFDLSLTPIVSVFRDISSHSNAPADISTALSGAIDEVIASAGVGTIYGVGLGVPGVVESTGDAFSANAEITIYAQSLNWPPTTLDAIYDSTELPIFADNGAKTLATAESWFGTTQDTDDALVALLGRGVGLGIVSGGRVLRGAASSAGEWGHTKVSIGGPVCNCGSRGCLEAYVGGAGIARRWREAGAEPSSNEEKALGELLAAGSRGDSVATRVIDETVEILGLGLSNLVNLFNPERVVLGGWAGLALAENHLAEIAAATRQTSLVRPGGQFDLVGATLGRDAVALGAALMAVESLIQNPMTRLDESVASMRTTR